eukprot:1935721-Amphidinium_carterae.1
MLGATAPMPLGSVFPPYAPKHCACHPSELMYDLSAGLGRNTRRSRMRLGPPEQSSSHGGGWASGSQQL